MTTHLFNLLGNQMVIVCRNITGLDEIFNGKKVTTEDIEVLENCIEICTLYRSFYVNVSNK